MTNMRTRPSCRGWTAFVRSRGLCGGWFEGDGVSEGLELAYRVGLDGAGSAGGEVVRAGISVEVTVGEHQRNAKLQLTVLLAPPEAVPGLYLHPDHRRRLRRPAVRSEFDV